MNDLERFRVKRWRDVKVDPETFQTEIESIFIAGDYRTGPTTIIEAVAQGRPAAQHIPRDLDPVAASVNVPEDHQVGTLPPSSVPDNLGLIAAEGERAPVHPNKSVDYH